MARADQPEDARGPCKTKFAVMTDEVLIWGCHGCLEPLPLPYMVLAGGKAAIKAYLSTGHRGRSASGQSGSGVHKSQCLKKWTLTGDPAARMTAPIGNGAERPEAAVGADVEPRPSLRGDPSCGWAFCVRRCRHRWGDGAGHGWRVRIVLVSRDHRPERGDAGALRADRLRGAARCIGFDTGEVGDGQGADRPAVHRLSRRRDRPLIP